MGDSNITVSPTVKYPFFNTNYFRNTNNIMPSTGIEHLSPELLQTIANYLPPSDVLKFSIAIKKAAFLKPDVDEVKINRNNMTRGKNYITNLLDFEVTSDVKEVMVTFEVETRVPVMYHGKIANQLFSRGTCRLLTMAMPR